MNPIEHIINLDLPPKERWTFLADYKSELNDLLTCYLDDFEGSNFIFEAIYAYKNKVISEEYLLEAEYIASLSKFSTTEVLVANLYYDVLKLYLGCTSFAFSKDDQVFHARNLDWWSENELLSKHSTIFDYQRNGATVFKTIGWPGFIGALSGIKPGKFSITLNAVLSQDPMEVAVPISFLLRDVLDQANGFGEAKKRLKNTTIASDCLLLLSGSRAGETVVIERTPKRHATIEPKNDFVCVTNDYKHLENGEASESEIQSSSCSRYNRAVELLQQRLPSNNFECLDILRDQKIMMGITMQQMVFNNTTGSIKLIDPSLTRPNAMETSYEVLVIKDYAKYSRSLFVIPLAALVLPPLLFSLISPDFIGRHESIGPLLFLPYMAIILSAIFNGIKKVKSLIFLDQLVIREHSLLIPKWRELPFKDIKKDRKATFGAFIRTFYHKDYLIKLKNGKKIVIRASSTQRSFDFKTLEAFVKKFEQRSNGQITDQTKL